MRFILRTAVQIVFGPGEGLRAPELAVRHGRRVFLVTGATSLERTGLLDALLERLSAAGAEVARWIVPGEPDVGLVDAAAGACREAECSSVLAVGGGSVIDTAKAVAALATNGGVALDYLEEVGGGREIGLPTLPVVAVPTTAGSGSEATRNSVLTVPHVAQKRSMRSDHLLPRVAIVDPAFSETTPRTVAAAAGLDALTHLVEAYVSTGAQPTTDALAPPGIRLAVQALHALAGERADSTSRERMALAALWGGIALANAGLGAVHGLAAPLGGRCPVPHGAACACLLPHTIAANVAALRRRAPDHPALARYEEVAAMVNAGDPSPERAASALERLRRLLGVPPLASFGFSAGQLEAVVAGSRGGSMRYNPVELTDGELEGILRSAHESGNGDEP